MITPTKYSIVLYIALLPSTTHALPPFFPLTNPPPPHINLCEYCPLQSYQRPGWMDCRRVISQLPSYHAFIPPGTISGPSTWPQSNISPSPLRQPTIELPLVISSRKCEIEVTLPVEYNYGMPELMRTPGFNWRAVKVTAEELLQYMIRDAIMAGSARVVFARQLELVVYIRSQDPGEMMSGRVSDIERFMEGFTL